MKEALLKILHKNISIGRGHSSKEEKEEAGEYYKNIF